jgi:hypothetical protein
MNTRQKFTLLVLTFGIILAAACGSAKPVQASMAGFWMDNDDNVTTIREKDGGFMAVTNYNFRGSSAQNTLVSSAYENGVLTWKYCPPAKPCITMQTVSFSGDTLEVKWTNANGESGTMTLKRTESGENVRRN